MSIHPQITGGEQLPGNPNSAANVEFSLVYSLFTKAQMQEQEILAMLKRANGHTAKQVLTGHAQLQRKHIEEVLAAL